MSTKLSENRNKTRLVPKREMINLCVLFLLAFCFSCENKNYRTICLYGCYQRGDSVEVWVNTHLIYSKRFFKDENGEKEYIKIIEEVKPSDSLKYYQNGLDTTVHLSLTIRDTLYLGHKVNDGQFISFSDNGKDIFCFYD